MLREEFPDVTISKIRFLESQGLIDPERTPSGYRKFYEADVSRLRWILHQQKENFLPLKVIKERLDRSTSGRRRCTRAPKPRGAGPPPGAARQASRRSPPATRCRHRRRRGLADRQERRPRAIERARAARARATRESRRTPPRAERAAPARRADAHARTSRRGTGERRRAAAADARSASRARSSRGPPASSDWQLDELESFGLLDAGRVRRQRALFDDEGQAIATAAAGFYAHGIERPAPADVQALRRARGGAVRAGAACSTAAAEPRSPRQGAGGARVAGPARARSCGPRSSSRPYATRSASDRSDAPGRRPQRPTVLRRRTCHRRGTSQRIAGEIAADHPDGVVLVGVLKGALVFLADLARAITDDRRAGRLPRDLAVRARLGPRAHPQGPRRRRRGRDVVIVEDLVDTGLTLAYLLAHVA